MWTDVERTLKERLDTYYDWPCVFLFKFIAPRERVPEVLALFGETAEVRTRQSSGGRYSSVTAELSVKGSDEVLELYRRAAALEGVLSL